MVTSSRLGLEDQLKLRIDKELRNQLDDIIQKMQDLAKQFNIKQVKERSPFKNVLTVATDSSSSLEVIKNYIRYQSGRKESSKIWKLERITEDGKKQVFADAAVNQINDLSHNFTSIFNAINGSLNEEIESLQEESQRNESRDLSQKQENLELLKKYLCSREQQLKQSIHLTLTQLYLGYLSREHTALVGSTKSP